LFNAIYRRKLTSLALILGIEPKVYRPFQAGIRRDCTG
jgi:hypothetical protein